MSQSVHHQQQPHNNRLPKLTISHQSQYQTNPSIMDSNNVASETDKQKRRKKRWGSAADVEGGGSTISNTQNDINTTNRSSVAGTTSAVATGAAQAGVLQSSSSSMDRMAKIAAIQESARARLAAIKAQRQQGAASAAVPAVAVTKRPPPASGTTDNSDISATTQRPVKRARHYELDLSVTGPTFRSEIQPSASSRQQQQQQQQQQQKQVLKTKKINPYLAHRQQRQEQQHAGYETSVASAAAVDSSSVVGDTKAADDTTAVATEDNTLLYDSNVDGRLEESVLAQSHDRRRRGRKQLSFVEPGTFVKIAERKRQKAANAAEAGFISGRKSGQYVQSTTIMANIYGQSNEDRLIDYESERLVDPDRLPARPEAGVPLGACLSSPADVFEEKMGSDRKSNKVPHVVEWWDMELLPSKLKKQIVAYEGNILSQETESQMKLFGSTKSIKDGAAAADKSADVDDDVTNGDAPMTSPQAVELREKCSKLAALSFSKTAELVQHIVPIKPTNAAIPLEEVQPVLRLTKKELKRQRKLRRQEKHREMQDLQAAGLIPPPEPRLTLKNFIRVLGDQAYVDPSQMEQKVLEQVQARQKAHIERNESRKLTREQRREKRMRKLQEDTQATGIHVALFYVKDMSHPYHRAKVDLNAQQFNLSGGVVECINPQISCIIVEGGPKAINKYIRLMLVRMKWTGTDDDEDEDEEEVGGDQMIGDDGVMMKKKHKFNKDNKCELVWTGIATKRFFKGFVFQACETSVEASKILRAKGVGHFWEQLLTHASGSGESFRLKLADDSDDGDDDDDDDDDDDEEEDDDDEKDKMQIDG